MQSNAYQGSEGMRPLTKKEALIVHSLLYHVRTFIEIHPNTENPPELENITEIEEYLERLANRVL